MNKMLLTQHQIMALCPFHMLGISVDKEIIGPVKYCQVVKSGLTAHKNCNWCHLIQLVQYSVTLKKKHQLHFALYVRSCPINQERIQTALHGKFLCQMKKFTVFQPKYWPCQFYHKQNIYKSFNKFINCQLGLKDSPHGYCALLTADYSSFPCPSTEQAHCCILNDTIPKNQMSQPSMLSPVLMIGGASPYFPR